MADKLLFPQLSTFRVKLPKPTKDEEYPEPVIVAQFEFGLDDALLSLLGRIARSGDCKMTLACRQGDLLSQAEDIAQKL